MTPPPTAPDQADVDQEHVLRLQLEQVDEDALRRGV
jgi:hypothetical protein